MTRYIDADAFEKQLNIYVEYNDDGEQEINADEVFITLHEQPTADVVERKKGKWTGKWIQEETLYTCSECHRGCWVNSNYCPWCGADMRGDT